MFSYNRSYINVLIFSVVSLFLFSCGKGDSSKEDYTSSFYHCYKSTTDKGGIILHLTRDTAKADEYDTVDRTKYTCSVIDETYTGDAYQISQVIPLGSQNFLFVYGGDFKDTVCFLSLKINGDASVLEGWKGKRLKSSNTNLPDSTPFKAEGYKNDIDFELYSAKGEEKLFPKQKVTPYLSYEFTVLKPINNKIDSTVFRKINKSIYELYHIKDTVSNPLQAVVNFRKNDWLERFKDEKPEDYKNAEDFGRSDLSDGMTRVLNVVASTPSILSVGMYQDDYGGGAAHNVYGNYYHNFNLRTGNKIQLKDIMNGTGIKQLGSFITAQIKKQEGMQPNQSLSTGTNYFESYIKPTSNFYLTPSGIGFHYNIYEISSFANGETVAFIPFELLEEYLKPEFKQLLSNITTNKN